MMMDGCEPNQRAALSVALGAGAAATGFDSVFPAPRGVHWALAGGGGCILCERPSNLSELDMMQLAMDMGFGYMGGFAFQYIRRLGVF